MQNFTIKSFFVSVFPAILALFVIFFLVMPKVRENREAANSNTPAESSLPEECQSYEDDVCGLFSCINPGCWCKEGPSGGVVYQENHLIQSEEAAKQIVGNYLISIEDSGYNQQATATKPNEFFFNVIATDINGDQKFLVVSQDGKVLETVCGI